MVNPHGESSCGEPDFCAWPWGESQGELVVRRSGASTFGKHIVVQGESGGCRRAECARCMQDRTAVAALVEEWTDGKTADPALILCVHARWSAPKPAPACFLTSDIARIRRPYILRLRLLAFRCLFISSTTKHSSSSSPSPANPRNHRRPRRPPWRPCLCRPARVTS